MKRSRFSILSFILLFSINQIFAITFNFSAGSIAACNLKTEMEDNVSALLTEINRAGDSRSELNLSGIRIEDDAKERLNELWNKVSRLVCEKQTVISKCLNDLQGYQVRGISVSMLPMDDSYNESLNRELTISLDKQGVITGVRLGWEMQEDMSQILRNTRDGGVVETRTRRELLKWMEDLCLSYRIRDLKGILKYLEAMTPPECENEKNKLLSSLKIMLADKTFSTVIDHPSVLKHGVKKQIYGLTIHQKFRTNKRLGSGWFFFLWDFNEPEQPVVRLVTWQPDEIVMREGVYTLDDFFIL